MTTRMMGMTSSGNQSRPRRRQPKGVFGVTKRVCAGEEASLPNCHLPSGLGFLCVLPGWFLSLSNRFTCSRQFGIMASQHSQH